MADPRDELAEEAMRNEYPGIPRLTVRPSDIPAPPPNDMPWGAPTGTAGRPSNRLFEPDLEPAAGRPQPPWEGGRLPEPDLTPAPQPRLSMVEALRTQNPLASTRQELPSLGESFRALPGRIGNLVQGASDYFSQPAPPPSAPRAPVDPTAAPRGMWQGGYPSPQQPTLLQRGVTEGLDQIERLGESQQIQFSPGATPEQRAQARAQGPGQAADVTLNVAGAGMAGASIRGGSSAGVFGGRLAHGADLQKQKLAELMEGNGVPANQIWKETGWMRGADKQWMHEIPDIAASYKGNIDQMASKIFDRQNPKRAGQYGSDTNVLRSQIARQDAMLKMQGKAQLYLEDVIDHPELFQRYPELRRMPVTHDAFMQAQGGYMTAIPGEGGKILYRETGPSKNMARGETLDTLLHEIQHAIQQIEGFARGANPSASVARQPGTAANKIFQKQMAQAPKKMDFDTWRKSYTGDPGNATYNYSLYSRAKDHEIGIFETQAASYAGRTAYRGSYGEQIANLAAQRKNMIPDQLAAIHPSSQLPPGKSYVEFNQYQPVPPRLEPKQLPLLSDQQAQLGGVLNPVSREMQMSAPSPLLRPPGRTMKEENWQPTKPTVLDPRRVFSPEIYRNPRLIAERAAQNVAAEHPALKELFGVTRADLYDISQQGRRKGNMEPEIFAPKKPGESYVAEGLATPQNEQRILDTLGEGLKHRGLREGMVPWYVMDPMFQHMVKLVGKEQAIKDYQRFNATTAPFSASSDVMTELNRGTAAHMYAKRGDYETFHKFAGADRKKLPPGFPADMSDVGGHAYHAIQSDPVVRWLATGKHGYGQQIVKIPTYHAASGVPETGFQTRWPVPDAHFARGVGAADVRDTAKPGVSMKGAEYRSMAPWYRKKIAEPLGIEAVPAQALQWGTMSRATGVDTPIGAGKLELLAQRIWERAQKLGIDPKELRDAVLRGDQHAVGLLTAGAGGAAGIGSLVDPSRYNPGGT